MQLAGKKCALCEEPVTMEGEGTWCARCGTVMHRACLEDADNICPACNVAYDKPENYFAYSKQCPGCLKPNEPPADRCAHCGAITRWDNLKAYHEFTSETRSIASRIYNRGQIQLVAALLSVGAFVTTVYRGLTNGYFVAPMFLIGIAFWCAIAGAKNLQQGRSLRTFQ
jgi:hypothetical protein